MEDLLSRLAQTSFEKILERILQEKCDHLGIDVDQNSLSDLSRSILSYKEGQTENLLIDDSSMSIHLDEIDIERFEKECDDFLRTQFSTAVQQAVRSSADKIFDDLKRKWPKERALQTRDRKGFSKRLCERWGKAFNLLDIYLTVAREIGSDFVSESCKGDQINNAARNDVLARLHARCCQVADEIINLLKGGFADGAMARWRTMHEISVVLALIREHGNDIAIRYRDHDIVEAYKFLSEYLKTYNILSFDPVSDQEISTVKNAYELIIDKYGTSFGRDYGWATPFIPASNSFKDLAAAAGSSHLSTHYKMASQNVHAGIKGITNKLGAMNSDKILLAGPSNAGLEEPGQCTAFTLALATMSLLEQEKESNLSVNNLLKMHIISDLQKDTIAAFVEIGEALKRESSPHDSE